MPRIPTQALALLAKQDNVIATWQVDSPTPHQMREAHNRGVWRQLTRFTYLAAPCEPTEAQLRWAAALHVGPAGLLSGQAALTCAGWSGKPIGAVDALAHAATNTVKRRNLMLETVTEFRGGATSMSEIDFGNLCRRYGLRQPDRQVRCKDARGKSRFIDMHFDTEAVTVEIDGLQHLSNFRSGWTIKTDRMSSSSRATGRS